MLRRLVGTTAPGHHDYFNSNEKVSNHGSIPITIDCNVVASIVLKKVKQRIIIYYIQKMLKEGAIRPIQSPYASPVVLTRKNNGLTSDSSVAYRFAIEQNSIWNRSLRVEALDGDPANRSK
ncbi:hypothetical protein TNCV_2381391 [Trichonephila clavipes]|nr:hypothetical protein TNCV_2381391 [Trichonephila clavipes]